MFSIARVSKFANAGNALCKFSPGVVGPLAKVAIFLVAIENVGSD